MTHRYKLLYAAAAGIALLAAGPTVAQTHEHDAAPAAAPPAAAQSSCPMGMPVGAGNEEMQHMAQMQQMMQQMHSDMQAMHAEMMQMRQQMQQQMQQHR
jgi:hypothetical protein